MIKFSEFFGQGKDEKKPDSPEQKKEEEKPAPPPIEFSPLLEKKESQSPETVPVEGGPQAESVPATGPTPSVPAASLIYNRFVDLTDRIFNIPEITEADMKEAYKMVEDIVDYMRINDQLLIEQVLNPTLPREVSYLVLNLVNVCILSIELGIGIGYNPFRLQLLGMAAFLHDIGMKTDRAIAEKKEKLTLQEKQKLHEDSLLGIELLKKFKTIFDPLIFKVIEEEHERDRIGYLEKEETSEYAQIIGLADVYEALTHDRPYRPKFPYYEAIKIILKDKASFNPRLIKILLDRIGLYPIGSIVELNTREVAVVLRQNFNMPACPIVRVIYDSEGRKLKKGKEIDLSEGTKIFIVGGKHG